MIEVRGLGWTRGGRRVLTDVDLRVRPGEVHGLLGPNGAGKTTLLSLLCGVAPVLEGSAWIAGHALRTDPDGARAHLGYAPETPPLYAASTPREVLRFAATLRRRPDPRADAERTLADHGLREVADRPCDRLSQGWRRRVGTALALVHDPSVVVLDEPTTGLDPSARLDLRRRLRALADAGRTVLVSTHELGEASAVCDRVTVLRAGRVVATVDRRDPTTRALRLTVGQPDDALTDDLQALPQVLRATRDGDTWTVLPTPGADPRPAVARVAAAHDLLALGPIDDLERLFLDAAGGPT